MKKNWLILFITALAINTTLGNPVIVCGKISNCSNKQIRLEIIQTDAILLSAKPIIIKSKTTNDGSFYLKVENINHFLLDTKLKIGSKIIYIALAPGDSINISFDYLNHSKDITFSGINASKNYFVNTFQLNYWGSSKTPDLDSIWLNKNQRLLNECSDKYRIDKVSKEFISQYLYCNYYNDLFTSPPFYRNKVKLMFDTLNINNEKLSWYHLYYSVLSGYVSYKENISLNLTKADGLEQAFKFSEKYFSGTIKENCQAYMISTSLLFSSSEIRNSQKAKNIMIDFVTNCKNDYLKNNMIVLLKRKRIL